MNTITAIKPVMAQRPAFGSNTQKKSETHPNKAGLSLIIPGSGQILNGDYKGGFARLGIAAGAVAGGLGLFKLADKVRGILPARVAIVASFAMIPLYLGNAVASAFAANKGNK